MIGRDEKEELRQTWVCESCGDVHVGVDPPDECSSCQGRYFENLLDVCTGK